MDATTGRQKKRVVAHRFESSNKGPAKVNDRRYCTYQATWGVCSRYGREPRAPPANAVKATVRAASFGNRYSNSVLDSNVHSKLSPDVAKDSTSDGFQPAGLVSSKSADTRQQKQNSMVQEVSVMAQQGIMKPLAGVRDVG